MSEKISLDSSEVIYFFIFFVYLKSSVQLHG